VRVPDFLETRPLYEGTGGFFAVENLQRLAMRASETPKENFNEPIDYRLSAYMESIRHKVAAPCEICGPYWFFEVYSD
jgi:hypothetical protein